MPSAPASPNPTSNTRPRDSMSLLRGISYDDVIAGKPPIPITTAPSPSSARFDVHPAFRSPTSTSIASKHDSAKVPPNGGNGSLASPRSRFQDDVRRDSGLATSSSTTRASQTTIATEVDSAQSIKDKDSRKSYNVTSPAPAPKTDSVRKFRSKWGGQRRRESNATVVSEKGNENEKQKEPVEKRSATSPTPSPQSPSAAEEPFKGIATEIPTSGLDELAEPGKVDFSKRGSILIAGQRLNGSMAKMNGSSTARGPTIRIGGGRRQSGAADSTQSTVSIQSTVLSSDDEALSQRVRSMYDAKPEREPPYDHQTIEEEETPEPETESEEPGATNQHVASDNHLNVLSALRRDGASSRTTLNSQLSTDIRREKHELAGGIEDWENIDNEDVDRYGFIIQRRQHSSNSAAKRGASPEPPRLQRVSTLLEIASTKPRRQRSGVIRSPSAHGSYQSNRSSRRGENPAASNTALSRRSRPASSKGSYASSSGTSRPPSRIRSFTNHLPHNRDRRLRDEAGDMLTLPPGLADIQEDEDGGSTSHRADALKRREWEREEKWRKMARQVGSNKDGRGMVFEFDTRSPKLISRTWKGIPDRWRATAWHAFLTASAKKRGGIGNKGQAHPTDEELIYTFQALLEQSSPDDVQIDIDVPRTISSHIMFRKRYRGGQRLLFRVLHCLSIYFPETGYVQGMAALAATILCYFDEEMAFVMLVRMWSLRGLARLYQSGFEGLMDALDEFEKRWLAGGEVAKSLNELGISSTAYGTRWYLTIFNYSIPFPAQLRVWDVFMLLGDPMHNTFTPGRPLTALTTIPYSPSSPTSPHPNSNGTPNAANKITASSATNHTSANSTTFPPSPGPAPVPASSSSTKPHSAQPQKTQPQPNPSTTTATAATNRNFDGGLDIIHATSAALINGMRDILLDSDFEGSMKTLTSWIPIRDEELLMRVAKAEWKTNRRRGGREGRK
ncbi:hypothetical protein MMC25_007925 [Agyrium rufum]|nr:hypothetical protein [Agyrium rufum]